MKWYKRSIFFSISFVFFFLKKNEHLLHDIVLINILYDDELHLRFKTISTSSNNIERRWDQLLSDDYRDSVF